MLREKDRPESFLSHNLRERDGLSVIYGTVRRGTFTGRHSVAQWISVLGVMCQRLLQSKPHARRSEQHLLDMSDIIRYVSPALRWARERGSDE